MKHKEVRISIRDLTKNYVNDNIEGVAGYNGKLDIRPKYQREFVYADKQRNAVIESILDGMPLNTMWWAKNETGFEVMDGQQRTISICEYVAGSFSFNGEYFHTLEPVDQNLILDHELTVQIAEGNSKEKLKWFERINIAGEKLTPQELRNAAYSGAWLVSAKVRFSKPNCPAHNIGKDYLKGKSIRQEYLETAIKWISDGNIVQYMADNQLKPNANELWLYFQGLIEWVETTFPNYRKEMKGVDWGTLYNEFKTAELDTDDLEKEISKLMQDESVTKKSGIYAYVLTRNEKYLSIRAFTPNQKREAYERQEGICVTCSDHFELNEMEGDHTTPWSKGGQTVSENCQMLCVGCNRTKSNK